MSAPVVWIIFPAAAAMLLYLGRRWERGTHVAGITIAILLALLAWQIPIGERIPLGPLSTFSRLTLSDTLIVLGRRFVLNNTSRPVLALVYVGIATWFGGAYTARTHRLFIPLGMAMGALFTAALAVQPFLYAALIIEIAALISVPILSPPRKQVGRGVLRFLTFQSLGMPLILLAGWMLSGVENPEVIPGLVLRVSVLVVLGLTLFMAIFPFHSWIPMVAEEAHPYSAAFVFFMLPAVISLFALGFINRYAWLQANPTVPLVLRFLGVLMLLTGGIGAAFQRHLGRMLGYAAITEIGMSLLALSLNGTGTSSQTELALIVALLLPRGISLALWAQALAALQPKINDLNFRTVQGLARDMPIAGGSLIIAHLSIAGLPLLAGFPIYINIYSSLAMQSLPFAGLALLGSTGLLVAGLRTVAVLIMGPEPKPWRISETRAQTFFLISGSLIILLTGLLPQWIFPALLNVTQVFGGP